MVETEGVQLEGNRDTGYKRAFLDRLSGAFGSAVAKEGELELERDPFTFSAAEVLFEEIEARLPTLIRGQPGAVLWINRLKQIHLGAILGATIEKAR